MEVDKILKLAELGFSAEQITQIMGLETTPSTPAPVEEHKVIEEVKEVEQPQLDYKKLAAEIALQNQRKDTVEPTIEKPVVIEKAPERDVKDVILGFL